MAFNIKNGRADELLRELTELTGESVESGHPGLLMIPESPEQVAQPTETAEEPQSFEEDSQWSSVY